MNLITPEKRLRALALAKTGQVVSLARQAALAPAGATGAAANGWQRDFLINANGAAVERLAAPVRGTWQTHLDGLRGRPPGR